jgi:predicted ester cyclase
MLSTHRTSPNTASRDETKTSGTTHSSDAAALIRDFYAMVDDQQIDATALERIVSNTFHDHNRPGNIPVDVSDKSALISLFDALKSAFSDGKHRLDILEPIGDDRAVVYWTFAGTHTGAFFGTPPSGNEVSIHGVDIFRVSNGLFVEQWHVEELMALFTQMAPRN